MTRPDGFWNEKTNTQPYPDRESYRWMHWLMVAALLVFAASVTGCVAYGNGVPL